MKEPEPAARGPLAPCPVPFGANTGSARAVPAPWKPLSARGAVRGGPARPVPRHPPLPHPHPPPPSSTPQSPTPPPPGPLHRELSCVAVGDLRGGPSDAALAGSSTACAAWSPRAKGARDPAGAAGPDREAKALVRAGGALLLGRGMRSAAVVVPVSRGLQDPGRVLSPGLPGIPGAAARQERAAGVADPEDRGVERLRTRPFLANFPRRP